MNTEILSPNLKELLSGNGNKKLIHLAQDFIDEKLFYGILLKGETHIINSDKKILSVSDLKSMGYLPFTETIEKSFFDTNGIKKFLSSQKPVNVYKIFQSLSHYQRRFILFKNEGYSELISLWIMATYTFRIFQYFPYLHITAEKASGKSLLLDVIAPVAFNGEISCNSTPAVIYRDIQINQPTMLIDEVESLYKHNPSGAGAIMDILKTGFSKSGTVKRCEGDKFIPKKFPTYCPKVLAGINPLEEVLSDRTIKIRMIRKLGDEKVERFFPTKELIEYHKTIRNTLYMFGLSYSLQISYLIQTLDTNKPEFDHLNNRNYDIWLPILITAIIIDESKPEDVPSIKTGMIDLSKKIISEKYVSDTIDNKTVKFLLALERMITHINPIWLDGSNYAYDTDSTLSYFQNQDEFIDSELTKTQLSRMLRLLDIEIKVYNRDGKTAKQYIIDRVKLSDLIKRYCI